MRWGDGVLFVGFQADILPKSTESIVNPFLETASKFERRTAVTTARLPNSMLYAAMVPTPPLPTNKMLAFEVIVRC